MKKLLVLFVALAVASTAFAADFSFSWDTDWGWASNFDDAYEAVYDELELAVEADIDEYNKFFVEFEPATKTAAFYDDDTINADGDDGTTPAVDAGAEEEITINNVLQMNSFKITTDLGAYLGLSGVGVSWVNGYADPGDEEYADVLRVGLQNAGLDAVDLSKDWTTDVNLDFGAFWASVAANWNLGAADAAGGTEYQFLVGTVDAVAGLSLEAGVKMFDDGTDSGNVFQVDGAYVFPVDDALSLTVAGSFANASEGMEIGSVTIGGTEYTMVADQAYGAGIGVDYAVDDMTALNASVEFSGDDDESFRELAGGVGLAYGDMGADVDFSYAMKEAAYQDKDEAVADGDLLGVDVSGFVKIGVVQFRVGYAVTEFGWDSNSRAAVPVDGGAYMRVTADF